MSARVRAIASAGAAVALGAALLAAYTDVSDATIERVQDATAHLRARGVTVDQIAARLSSATGISHEKAAEIVAHSIGRHHRDARSLRSIEVHMAARVADLATAEAAVAAAWCAPLDGLPEHGDCVADQAGWFAGSLCSANGTVRARWASLRVRPAEGRRLQEAATAGLYEGQEATRAQFIAWAARQAVPLTICDPVTP